MVAPRCVGLVVVALGAVASADPAPAPVAADPLPNVLPPAALTLDIPVHRKVPSLRIEAARVAAERFTADWPYPEPGPLITASGGQWFLGAYQYGTYSPRSGRAAALHGGSVAATLLGEILMSADAPIAGLGALLTGATLDAAAADADHAAEARR